MSPKNLTRTLTVKYALTLLVLAGLAAANYLILASQIHAQRFVADVVNTSGRQRDLLRQVAILGPQGLSTIVLSVWLIAIGLLPLLHVGGAMVQALLNITAIAAGVLLLMDR